MKIRQMTKRYQGKTVVDGVSFSIPKGKVTSLIGPNGAGKSTVMSMISRLIAQDEGLVDLDGTDVGRWKSRELARRLAILTQSNHIDVYKRQGLGSVVKANCHVEAHRKVEAGEVIFARRRKIDGVDSRVLEDALYAFGFGNQCSYVQPFGAGHINETYAVYMPGENGEEELSYVLQRINTHVFKKPREVMENIFGAVSYTHLDVYKRQAQAPACVRDPRRG